MELGIWLVLIFRSYSGAAAVQFFQSPGCAEGKYFGEMFPAEFVEATAERPFRVLSAG
jgi:hypothetical protein